MLTSLIQIRLNVSKCKLTANKNTLNHHEPPISTNRRHLYNSAGDPLSDRAVKVMILRLSLVAALKNGI